MSTSLAERLLAPGGLTPVFQPIVRLRRPAPVLHAYECLTRGPEGTNLHAADVLFEYVRAKRLEYPIDLACVETALRAAARLPRTPPLSLNVHGVTLATEEGFDEALARIAAETAIDPSRLTIEIVEHSPALDTRKFRESLARLRALGVSIALDDVGLGQSNYRMMIDVEPEYLKIDRYFVTGCETDPKRRAILESIVDLGRRFGSEAIAEGVERPEELDVLRGLGIQLVQGYLFGRPAPADELAAAGFAAGLPNREGRSPGSAGLSPPSLPAAFASRQP